MNLKQKTIEIARISKVVSDFKNERNAIQSQMERDLKNWRIDSLKMQYELTQKECEKAGIKRNVIDKIVDKWK